MKKKISILGSTGSIGLSTLKIIDKNKKDFKINLLSANKSFKLIYNQIKKYKPNYFIIKDQVIFEKIKKKIKKSNTKILNSFNFKNSKNINNYITVSAIPGIAGLSPTITMVKNSKKILIANKESIICGWHLIKKESIKYNTKIIPVDSEHFSIFKILENHNHQEIKKIYITASGGPFLKNKLHLKKKINPKDALKHPKWRMGKKISIDSSTLMNKVLEHIEAQKLFNISSKKIDILIHPESLVHAIVKFKNGLTKFIYHETSMIIPIANAIYENNFNIEKFYNRKKVKKNIENLTFEEPNSKIFPIIKLKNRSNEYPSTSIIVNASNEILVDHFLNKKIPFLAISKIIMSVLNDRNYKKYAIKMPLNLNQITKIDMWARKKTLEKIHK
jgi:1-deoxy-D-xylulose-5-phosphate reductoisomerase